MSYSRFPGKPNQMVFFFCKADTVQKNGAVAENKFRKTEKPFR